jgi:predicted amidohydrolase
MSDILRIAVLQDAPVTRPPDDGIDRLDAAAARAAGDGAALLVTPEMYLSGYAIGAGRHAALAATADTAIWAAVAAIARRHAMAIVAGGPLPGPNGGTQNVARLFDADGNLLITHAKAMLHGALDRDQFVPGAALSAIADVQGWKVGLAICYEIEFPEIARGLAQRGADLIAVPTANMEPYRSVCTRLVPARAEENGLAIAYANMVGQEPGLTYCGLSVIAGPDGADLARAGHDAALLVATLSRAEMDARRAAVPYLQDLRNSPFGGF